MVSGKSITNSIMLVKPATCWQFGMSKYYPRDYEGNYPMPYCGMLRGQNSCIVFGLIQLFIKYTRHSAFEATMMCSKSGRRDSFGKRNHI